MHARTVSFQVLQLEAWVRAIGARQDYERNKASAMFLQRMLRRLTARARFGELLALSPEASRPVGSTSRGCHAPTATDASLEIGTVLSENGPRRVSTLEELEQELLEGGDGRPLSADAEAKVAAMVAAFKMEDVGIDPDAR